MPDRTLVPRAQSTVLPPLQMAPWSNAARRAVGQQAGPSEDHSLHPGHRTAVGQQAGPSEDYSLHPGHRTAVGQQAGPSEDHSLHPGHRTEQLRQDHAETQRIGRSLVPLDKACFEAASSTLGQIVPLKPGNKCISEELLTLSGACH